MLTYAIIVALVGILAVSMHQFWKWRYFGNYRMPPQASLMLAAGSTLMLFEVFVKAVD